MDKKEKEEVIAKLLEDQDVFKMMSVEYVNHNPHPFMIGPLHVSHAADNYSGILDERTLRKINCSHKGCTLMYDDHTYDTVCFLQLLRNVPNTEASVILKKISEGVDNGTIDGFAFVETEEEYRII